MLNSPANGDSEAAGYGLVRSLNLPKKAARNHRTPRAARCGWSRRKTKRPDKPVSFGTETSLHVGCPPITAPIQHESLAACQSDHGPVRPYGALRRARGAFEGLRAASVPRNVSAHMSLVDKLPNPAARRLFLCCGRPFRSPPSKAKCWPHPKHASAPQRQRPPAHSRTTPEKRLGKRAVRHCVVARFLSNERKSVMARIDGLSRIWIIGINQPGDSPAG